MKCGVNIIFALKTCFAFLSWKLVGKFPPETCFALDELSLQILTSIKKLDNNLFV